MDMDADVASLYGLGSGPASRRRNIQKPVDLGVFFTEMLTTPYVFLTCCFKSGYFA